MTYLLEEVARHLRETLDKRIDVSIATSTLFGRIDRVQLYRNVPWSSDGHGGAVDVVVSIDNASVSLKVISTLKDREHRHGVENSVQASLMALGFITSDDGGWIMQVHARYGRKPKVHDLKSWPEHFRAVSDCSKTFEWRKDDRGFAVGDVLLLREWEPPRDSNEPGEGKYTSFHCRRVVTNILKGGQLGVPHGFVVMGLGSMP